MKITCPHCHTGVELTEALVIPLVQEKLDAARAQGAETAASDIKHQYEERIRSLKTQADARQKQIETLTAERQSLAQAEAAALRAQQIAEEKIARQEALVEKAVMERMADLRIEVRQQAAEEVKLPLREKEETINSLRAQIESLRQRVDRGSQQLQGEVQELDLEETLKTLFPLDTIEPVAKGTCGGDVLQTVRTKGGQAVGKILWEAKRTKSWSQGWLPKLREDQRNAGADAAILMSVVTPEAVGLIGLVDDVWVCQPKVATALAISVRQGMLAVASARSVESGQKTRMQALYEYMTGLPFRQRLTAIIERFQELRDGLEAERTAMTRAWAKREKQLGLAMEATVGIYGDLQGVCGEVAIGELPVLKLLEAA